MNNQLIVVEQLPVIKAYLKEIEASVDAKVKQAESLVVTPESKQVAKKIRADLNKEFEQLEVLRKHVKTEVLKPYNDFEELYKTSIKEKYKKADRFLAQSITDIESVELTKKQEEAIKYFNEYIASVNLEYFITFERLNVKINLSTSLTAIKKSIAEQVDKIVADLNAIKTMQYSEEILVEYNFSLNFAQAVAIVNERHKKIEQLKPSAEAVVEVVPEPQVTEEALTAPTAEQAIEPVIETQPNDADEPILTLAFKVRGTLPKLKALKQFLIEGEYDYE